MPFQYRRKRIVAAAISCVLIQATPITASLLSCGTDPSKEFSWDQRCINQCSTNDEVIGPGSSYLESSKYRISVFYFGHQS